MNASDRELLAGLLEHDASGWIPELHADDCDDDACVRCEPQVVAAKEEAKAKCDPDCRGGWIHYQARDGEYVELRCTTCNPRGGESRG